MRLPLPGLRACVAALVVLAVVSTASMTGRAAPAIAATLGDPRGEPTVAAYGGWAAWSTEVSGHRWRLVVWHAGEVVMPRLAPRTGAFDVDLGPGPHGPAAVYSRCATATVCDLYRYDLESGREVALRRLNTSESETRPAIWRANVAFVRRDPHASSAAQAAPHVYLFSRGRVRMVGTGTYGRQQHTENGYEGLTGPTRVDLRGTTVGFTWQLTPTTCAVGLPRNGSLPDQATEVWIARAGRTIRLNAGCLGDPAANFSDITLGPATAYFSYMRAGDPLGTTRYRSQSFSGGIATERLLPVPGAGFTASFAQDDASTVYLDRGVVKRDAVFG